jgi:outer membrane protein, heavy metal efflux system
MQISGVFRTTIHISICNVDNETGGAKTGDLPVVSDTRQQGCWFMAHHHLSLLSLLTAVTVAFGQDSPTTAPTALNLPLPSAVKSSDSSVTKLQPRALSLEDMQSLALQNHPTLSAASARINAARGRALQAGLYPNPTIGYHGMEMGNFGTAGQQGGYVMQRFITARKLKLDQAAAGQKTNEAHFQFHAQEQRVLTDVQIRFYEALAAQRRFDLTKDLLQIGADLVKATEKLIEGRQRSENDLLQAQIRADEAEILLENSRNEFDESWRRLMAVVGTPTLAITSLSGDLATNADSLDWNIALEMLLAGHPELSMARARAERARILILRAKREPIPNIDLSVSIRHMNTNGDNVADIQVGIPIPVFNRNQGNIAAAEAEWVAACREIERIELQLQDRLAIAYRRYANARQQAQKYSERIVPRAERSLSLVTQGYESGQVEYLTLLVAQQTYLQARLASIDSLRELQTAAALIEGQLLKGSLSTPPSPLMSNGFSP